MTNRMLDVEPVVSDRTAGPVAKGTAEWLASMGLDDCHDPNAMILTEAALDLDELNRGKQHLTAKDMVMARGKVRHTITTARRALQGVIDESARERITQRHRQVYGETMARTMGWIDADMLSPELRTQVAEYLKAVHDIDLADADPEIVRL